MSRILFLSKDQQFKEKNIEILVQNGLDVVGVSECSQGLLMLDKNKYDAIVIDDELTDADSFETCRKIRQKTDSCIVLLGTPVESEVWAKVDELGFDIYLRKRFSPWELLVRLQALIRQPDVERKREPLKPVAETSEIKQPHMQDQDNAKPKGNFLNALMHGKKEKGAELAPVPPQPQLASVSIQAQPPVKNQNHDGHRPDINLTTSTSSINQSKQLPRQNKPEIRMVENMKQQTPIVNNISSNRNSNPGIQPSAYTVGSATQQASPVSGDGAANIFEDARVLKLADALVNGKLTDIIPVIDFNLKAGYEYPAVEGILDSSEQDAIDILNTLADNDVLIRQLYEKFYVDPDGAFQLVPVEHCPRDDSSNLVKGQLVEHFSCGYVGLDRDFRQESRYICPKCRKDLRLIGTDYRNIGVHYRCQDDGEIFTTPVIKWRNLKTRKEWTLEELRDVEVYSYRFNPDKRGWLEFQLKPKAQLVDFLRSRGYVVQEFAQLTGRSGAVHTLDIMAVRDDVLMKIDIGIGILAAPASEPEVGLEALFKFDTHIYDIGIDYKVVIVIPKLGMEASNFARRQMINAFESRSMASIVSDIVGTTTPQPRVASQGNPEVPETQEVANAISIIVRFLRNKGYEVVEHALIPGKSGVGHVFDIYARIDDKIIVPTIAIGVANGINGQPVGMDQLAIFDAAAFDSGIRNKVFLGLPQLSDQAKQFARQQKIDVIEQKDLNRLV